MKQEPQGNTSQQNDRKQKNHFSPAESNEGGGGTLEKEEASSGDRLERARGQGGIGPRASMGRELSAVGKNSWGSKICGIRGRRLEVYTRRGGLKKVSTKMTSPLSRRLRRGDGDRSGGGNAWRARRRGGRRRKGGYL